MRQFLKQFGELYYDSGGLELYSQFSNYCMTVSKLIISESSFPHQYNGSKYTPQRSIKVFVVEATNCLFS